ncbi:methyltransferase domain-containing protein [Clostridium tyrobutyricum]|uniref:methyltransferase domain-containing protein n=2 Tax=Clostridium tyrobutyricum TaxID=1519 RepID=UPI0020CDF615|nr:methyltransferase domain-containing protein [Clostridium tyrobutyricum]
MEIGCGTGELTLSLSKLFPSSHITAVDIAPGMIDTAKSKFKNQYIDFICDDIENMKIKHNYDLIISNAAFQWFNNLQKTVDKLYVALNSAGILCFSTFGQYTFCELKECFNKAGKMLSLKDPISPGQVFYNLDDLTLLCNNIVNNRLHGCKSLVESKEMFEYEYFNNFRDFLYSIKKIGASSSNKQTKPASPAFIRKVISLYNENYMKNNRVKATYHCLFFKITK